MSCFVHLVSINHHTNPSPSPAQPVFDHPISDSPAGETSPSSRLDLPSEREPETPPSSIWEDPELSPKIRDACRIARENGYQYIWIDSCCIDKTSSSELSEAINSMYLWYGQAHICYAFLADVPAEEDRRIKGSGFRKSAWFTRGWTLQELIAPFDVIFFSGDWVNIGSKHDLHDLVEDVTGISYKALLHMESLDHFSVAQRLSWAEGRKTTREEDRAYSLLGIFDINMPTLYGEGTRAFRRLQEEIMRRVPDQSLFAWEEIYLTKSVPQNLRFERAIILGGNDTTSLLAGSPDAFQRGGSIGVVSHDEVFRRLQRSDFPAIDYVFTPHGIRTAVPVMPLSGYLPSVNPATHPKDYAGYLAILGCEHKDFPGHLLGRVCYSPPSQSGVEFLRCGNVSVYPLPESGPLSFPGLFPLSQATLDRWRSQIEVKTVYIPHPDRAPVTPRGPEKMVHLMLAKETRDALRDRGYTATLRSPDEDHPTTHRLTLSNDRHAIAVEYQHTIENDRNRRVVIRAHAEMSSHPLDSAGDGLQVDRGRAVSWFDSPPWRAPLRMESVVLNEAGGRRYTVNLGLSFAGAGYYALRVEVHDATISGAPLPSIELPRGVDRDGRTGKGKERAREGDATA